MGLLTMDNGIVNWGEHNGSEETKYDYGYQLQGNEESLCSKTCIDSYNTLKTLCDEQMNQLGDQEAQILAYSQVVKKLEAQLSPSIGSDTTYLSNTMSSMGELTFFLGLQVKQNKGGIFISQDKYVAEILKKFDLVNVKAAITPMETKLPLTKDEEAFDVDVHLYRSMIGSLMYLTASRPDIMYAVCVCSRFQVTPKTSHLNAVKRIFKYLKGKPNLGLWYPRESPFDLEAFSDSDYGGSNLDRKSTTGGCQFLGQRLISWQCKKQTIVATSTTEAEYVAAANCCGQVLWVQNQLLDYGFNFMNTKIHIDNESTICIVKNPVYHSKTKHIEIRHHFIRDCYEKKLISVEKIHTDLNVADLLTKPFDGPRFNYLVVSIVKQFWQTATAKTIADGTLELHATIDTTGYTITEQLLESSSLIRCSVKHILIELHPTTIIIHYSSTISIFTTSTISTTYTYSYPCIYTYTYPATDPEPMKHTFEEPSPAHQHFSTHKSSPRTDDFGLFASSSSLQLMTKFMVWSKKVKTLKGEEQVEDISPNTLEAAKTLSKIASQKPKSIDKGRRYKRRKETKGKKVVTSLDFQEEVEEASLVEAIRLDTLEKEEEAKQHYTDEDWDLIRAKIEANAELSKSVLGSDLQREDFVKKMVDLNQGTWKLSQLKEIEKYPLSAEVCKAMLDKKLQGGKPDEDCYKLLKWIEKQADENELSSPGANALGKDISIR
ncbi:putative ribonuclease H-like domain-containing protein [Tanacetum coccineum]